MPLINTENCMAQEIVSRQRERFPELEGYTLKTLYFSEGADGRCSSSDTDIGPVDKSVADQMKPDKLCQVIDGNSSGTVKAIYSNTKGVPKTIYDHSMSESMLERLRRLGPKNESFFANLTEAKWEMFLHGMEGDDIEQASLTVIHDYLCGCFDDDSVENLVFRIFQTAYTKAALKEILESQ